MKFLTVITLLASCWYLCSAAETSSTVLARAKKFWALRDCKQFISNNRNSFTDWFPLDIPIKDDGTIRVTPFDDTIRLRFLVLSTADVHVMFSPTEIKEEVLTDWRTEKPMYHFQIGSRGNLESLIWSSVRKEQLKLEQTPNLLRFDQPNEIEIELKKDGNMVVLCNGKKILEAQDKTPLSVKYFSFASWESPSFYYYDCESEVF